MIYAYSGISPNKLDETHAIKKTKKSYTLRHNDKLVASTNYKGQGQTGTTSQGWERNKDKFFNDLQQKHPEMFSRANMAKLNAHQSPRVDDRMVKHVPELKSFKGEKLVHHHIGGDGQAVAVPQSMHSGYGGIHNVEKEAGVTQNCQKFSSECEQMLKKNPNMTGKSVDAYRAEIRKQTRTQQISQGEVPKASAAQKSTQPVAPTIKRSNATRATGTSSSKKATNVQNNRANAVRKQSSVSHASSGTSRAQAVRSSTSTNATTASVKQAVEQGQKRKR